MKELIVVTVPRDKIVPGEAFVVIRTLHSENRWVEEAGVLVFRDTENPEAPLEPVQILAGERNEVTVPVPANDG